MSGKRLVSKNGLIAIIAVLILSFIFNTAMIIEMRKYRYKIDTEGYNYIEEVRSIHESNIQLLAKAIDSGSIDNMDVLKLYTNYSDLTEDIDHLWNEYIYYEENRKLVVSKKNIDTRSITVNDVNSKIEDFFNDTLEMEMKNQNYKLELTGNMLENFKEIYNLENEKSSFYSEFCNNQLNGLVQDEKKNMIINKHYWIDILEGYNKINDKYTDFEFKVM